MGGDSFYPPPFSTEGESSSLTPKFPLTSIASSVFSGNEEGLSHKSENCSVINGESGLNFGGFQDERPHLSLISEATERQRVKVYAEVLRSYEELQSRIDRLEEAKSRILSYTPGAWAEKIDSMDLSEYDIPNTMSLLLIGPKGSGKSSLINKISRVLENDIFVSGSPRNSKEDGTYFLHEYVIPRGSGSFCLYDTRSLSDDSSENLKMLQRWMTKGVCHGELVKRKSDSEDLKARLKCKARRSRSSSQFREINFVIFVVNGLSVLECMDRIDGKKKEYSQMIATNFNNPLLSFKESNDTATNLAIVDMLIYCLERADRNLPPKDLFVGKVPSFRYMLLCIVLAMAVVFQVYRFHDHQPLAPAAPSPMQVDWYRIRHLWLG
ncbi:UNVERIFIED_CONTAM: hypothetical protein Slati_0620900 [Sesamum latifolium]|uniref:G domain-containing protein n=1 Tax=Sesamum latifolium TaxID=2727402 RepID=A0AAW2Y2H8_9LAMI